LFNLKKKVKNRVHVEASICEAYIVEEISTFILYYFEPHLRTRINRVPRHDDGSEVLSSGNLLIFSNTGRPTPKNVVRRRYLSEIEFKQAHNYVLFNCDELRPFVSNILLIIYCNIIHSLSLVGNIDNIFSPITHS